MKQTQPEKKKTATSLFTNKLLFPLMLLSLASFGVLQLTPLLVQNTPNAQPSTLQLAVVGISIILLSSLFLGYTAKVIGLTRGWLVLGILFSSSMIITKFILIPKALYSQVFTLSNFGSFDPNNASGYILIALVLFAIYAGVFRGAYWHYKSKRDDVITTEDQDPTVNAPRSTAVIVTLFLLGFVVLAASGAGAILFFPVLFLGAPFSYISYAIIGGGILLVLMTVMTIILSIKYLEHASNKAIETKNATILTITFWVGLSLILIYHVLWVIYMSILLVIWPFKTISPSGK